MDSISFRHYAQKSIGRGFCCLSREAGPYVSIAFRDCSWGGWPNSATSIGGFMALNTQALKLVPPLQHIEQKQHSQPLSAEMTRRSFIRWIPVGWCALTATVALMGTLTMRFFFPNVLFEPSTTFEAGFSGEIQDGEADERFKSSERVWLVRQGNIIYALIAICTHLGCTPNWLPAEQKFKCPCQGRGYYK